MHRNHAWDGYARHPHPSSGFTSGASTPAMITNPSTITTTTAATATTSRATTIPPSSAGPTSTPASRDRRTPPLSFDDATGLGPGHRQRSPPGSPPASSNKVCKTGRLACDVCRERKVRCDRDWPKCGRCVRLGDPCGYQGRARHRKSQADVTSQLKELQDRLAQAEARLSSQGPSPPRDTTATITAPHNPAVLNASAPQERDMPQSAPSDMGAIPSTAMYHRIDVPGHFPDDTFSLTDPEFDWCIPPWSPYPTGVLASPTDRLNSQPTPSLPADDQRLLFDQKLPRPPGRPHSVDEANAASLTDETLGQTSPPATITRRSRSATSSAEHTDEQPSASDLRNLHDSYFDTFYPTMPILSKDRFFSSVQSSADVPQVQALSYAVALVGTMVSPSLRHFEGACLGAARRYIELCERDEGMSMMLSLDLFQAFVFLIRFELTNRNILRAWMTIGRAVRLANILNLHLDKPNGECSEMYQQDFSSADDPVCLEERRRSFWTLYICETYASSRAKLRPLLHEKQISVPLPSPGTLGPGFQTVSSPTLAESYNIVNIQNSNISSFAGIVLACAVVRRCQIHAESVAQTDRPQSAEGMTPATSQSWSKSPGESQSAKGFWDSHFSLLTILKHRYELLAPHLTVRSVQSDPVAFGLYVYLCGIDIALQEVAVSQVEQQDLSPTVAADSARRSRAAAYRLVGAARATQPKHRHSIDFFALHGVMMARPVATAVQVLGRDLRYSPNDFSTSTVADSIDLLLGALDRVEEEEGFWHQTVAPIAQAAKDWEERHGDRPADAWAATIYGGN